MKKVIIMLILALNFVCYADGFTYMKPEEAEALINYYNSSTFPIFTFQDTNLMLQTTRLHKHCSFQLSSILSTK